MSFKGLQIGVSGLQSQSKKMEIVSNNLANLNTSGFKKAKVNFKDAFYDTIKNASGATGNLGGTNAVQTGGGVSIASVDSVFTQGARNSTGRDLDFMIEGDDFFVSKNGADGNLMLTRNGNFGLDGKMQLVDTLGNKVQGFNVNPESGAIDAAAGNITIPSAAISPNATTIINAKDNLDSSVVENVAEKSTAAWDLFSGGENFGNMSLSVPGGAGSRVNYGSGFYEDNTVYKDAAATLDGTLSVVTLNAAPTNLVEGFKVGDKVSVLQGANQVQRTITAINTGTRQVTLSAAAPAGFAAGTLAITNLSDGASARGTSGTASIHNDVLNSQISMIDKDGNLVASFYRVSGHPAEYSRATANVSGGTTITVGMGEFTNIGELKEGMERALRDAQLSNYAASTDLSIGLDKFGKINFSGTGLVQDFRLVMNADNTEMLDRFASIAMTDSGAIATTQARVDASGNVIAPPSLAMATRTVHSSKQWYSTTGLENYGFNTNNQSTEYGEFAGLKVDNGATGAGYGVLELSMTNALGQAKTQQFKLVPRDPDPNTFEFSTMGELSFLLQTALRGADFSTTAVDGALMADQTASSSFNDGRLSISTTNGVFDNLKLTAINTATTATITRSDSMNFGTVLGALSTGINGKNGASNQFIQADARSQSLVFDSQGNEHTVVTHFVRDRSSGLTNVEWKYKNSLNLNLNTFSAENTTDKGVYGNTYNSIEDTASSSGVLAFDITSGDVLGTNTDSRYKMAGDIKFTAQKNSQEANGSNISLDFKNLTSFNGKMTVIANNIDGYSMGNLVRISSEQNTGYINGVYSNGKIRVLAKLGLMSIPNAEGLKKVGSSYYEQTTNSSGGFVSKGLDQVFYVGAESPASSDSIQSKIHGGSLEASNVDLTEELTDMIVTQRSYSASGKVITSTDDMLQEALNLKR